MSAAPSPPIDVLIVTPLDEERDAVLNRLRRATAPPRQLPPVAGESAVYHRATLPVTFSDKGTTTYGPVVACIGEMGQPEAAAAVASGVARWRPRAVLIVGIAGGIAANGVGPGDLLIANRIIGYELTKARTTGQERRWQPYDVDRGLLQRVGAFADRRWHRAVARLRPEPGSPGRHIGPFASGDKIIQDPALVDDLLQTWPKLIGVAMEAVGGAAGGRQASPPPALAMIRVASDLADPDKESPTVKEWRPYACAVAAAYAVAFLRSGPLPPPPGRVVPGPTDTVPPPLPGTPRTAQARAWAKASEPPLRALARGSRDQEVLAREFMVAFAADLPHCLPPRGEPSPAEPCERLRAGLVANMPRAAAFAAAARGVADHDAGPAALALFAGLADLVPYFSANPVTLMLHPDPLAELALFTAHEAFLTLIAP